MFKKLLALSAALLIVTSSIGADAADIKVTVSDMHLCCGACVTAVKKAVAKVEGVKETVDQDGETTVLVGKKEAVQKAIDELAAAGFHGKLDNKEVAFKDVKIPDGKVKKIEIVGIHNCCAACNDGLKKAVKTVKGVTSENLTAKKDSFTAEGDFVAKDLITALLDAGFHCKIKE